MTHSARQQHGPDLGKQRLFYAGALAAVFLFLAAAVALNTPHWQPYDEPWHFTNIDTLVREGRKATLEESTEAHQPPLYYAVLSLAMSPDTPYRNICPRLRLAGCIFGLLAVLLIFDTLCMLLNQPAHAALMTLLIMNNAMFLEAVATITNDAAAIAFSALTFRALAAARGRTAFLPHVLVGACAGLALLSKATCLFLVPCLVVFYLLERAPLRRRLALAASCFAVLSAVAGWWYLRNIIAHGDPTGSNAMLVYFETETRNLLSPRVFVRWNALLFTHFWNPVDFLRNQVPGHVFEMNYYELLITAIPFAGFVLGAVRERSARGISRTGVVMAAAVLLLWFEIFSNSFRAFMPTGRFLFPALLPMGYLWYRGMALLTPRKLRGALILALASGLFAYNMYLFFHVFPALAPMPFDAPFNLR